MRDQLSPSTSSIHDVNELPNSDAVEAESLPERNSSESSNETEMFNVSMERGEDESFVSETTHELLSCVDCSMKQERIENLQKSRSKLKTPKANLLPTSKRFVATNLLAQLYISCGIASPELDIKNLNNPNFKRCISF